MTTIYLCGNDYETPLALHRALQMLLGLPEYYGCNADALHDCLSERKPIRLWISGMGEGETALALQKCMRVVEDLQGEARLL